MNDKAIEIYCLYADLQDQMQSMDDEMRKLQSVTDSLEAVESLMQEVRTYGFTDYTVARMQKCEMLKDLTKLDLCIKYKSVEGLGQPEQTGLQRFFATVTAIIKKIIEFFQNLFNTASAKCRQVIKDRSLIKLDKPVRTYKKEDLQKAALAANVLKTYMDERVRTSFSNVTAPEGIDAHLTTICQKMNGVVMYAGKGIFNISRKALMLNPNMTLDMAGWTVNDGTNLASNYLNKAKSFTTIGTVLVAFINANRASKTSIGHNSEDMRFIWTTYNADTSMYATMAHLQAAIVKQVLAFYQCIDDSNVVDVKAA